VSSERFHVVLASAGRPVMQGWWASEATARDKVTDWIGLSKGPRPRVTLVDEETGETLTSWPDEV
jgi:hypothetical protein